MDKNVFNDDRVQIAKKRYQLSSEYCKPYFDRFLDNYQHYFLRIIDQAIEEDDQAYPFYSQIMLPISYQIVETILPRMFQRLPNFSLQTEEPNDEKDERDFAELIRYQMNHPYLIDDPVTARMISSLKEVFITGNSWGSVPWFSKKAKITEWQPYSPELGLPPSWENMEVIQYFGLQPQWALVEVEKTVIDAPVYTPRSVFHVFPDPKKKRVTDLGWVIEEEMMTKDEIMVMVNSGAKGFKNISELKDLKGYKGGTGSGTSKNDRNYDQEIANMFGSDDFSDRDETEPQYKVWLMKEPNRWSVIVNECLTIYDGANFNGDGKLGLFLMKDIPVPGELFAWGEIDPIKRIEDGMTDQFNMRSDSVFYDLLRMWTVEPNSLVDGEEFVPEPGTVVQVKNQGAIAPLETGTTKASAYREYQEWEALTQAVSGVTDYASGSNSPGMNNTLGGVELLQQAANARFALKLQLFEQIGLKAMGTMYVQRNIRFFDTPQNVPSDYGKITITPDQVRRIRGTVHFIVEAGSTEAVNVQTELQKWKFVADLIKENAPPFDNLSQDSKDKIARRMLSALKVHDAEELIVREQPQQIDPATGQPIPQDQQQVLPATGNEALTPEEQAAMAEAEAMAQAQVAQQGGANAQPNQTVV